MILIMAWRNIWRNKTRSIVIIFSVAIGLLAGLGVLALYKGMLNGRVRNVIDLEVAHIQIHHPEFKKDYRPSFIISHPDSLMRKIQSYPEVKLVALRMIAQGMLVTATGSAGVQINGVDPEVEYKISRLKAKFIAGEGFHSDKKNEIIIGKNLADKMKLKQGSKVVLTLTDTSDNIVSSAFRVSSIYQSDNAPLDELNVYVLRGTLNELLTSGNSADEIAILLKSDTDLESMEGKLKNDFPSLLVESWKEISPETELMVKTVDQYSYIIMIIILIAVAFGILNTMMMSVLERTREIGMMVALGTSRIRMFLLIFFETIFLTIAGAPVGLGAAYLITSYYEKNGLNLSSMGKEMMASFGYSTLIYPSFPWEKITTILIMVIGTAIVSCLLPAIRVLLLQPVEALRR